MFHCFHAQQQQGVTCSCKHLFCPSFSLYVCFHLSFLTIVLCTAYRNNGTLSLSLTYTHTRRYLSKMPSGGCLCLPDILHQTNSNTVYKAPLHGADKSNRSEDMCTVHDLTSGSSNCSYFSSKHVRIQSVPPLMILSSSDVCFCRMRRSLSRR